jgi:3-phosphoshikimate 1-carboxyvinyltransferase
VTVTARFDPAGPLRGDYTPPADKSISHRAALFAGMCDEPVTVENYLDSEDTLSTLNAVRTLGAGIEEDPDGRLVIRGVGLHAPLEATGGLLNVGNAGTLMRLLPGWLAGQPGGVWTLDGDDSIRRRPVDRVAEPLRLMGAGVEAREGRFPPFTVRGAPLAGIEYELPVASAQVKSCVLLAGLYATGGRTEVVEPAATRDHTERMLEVAGVRVRRKAGAPAVWPAERLRPLDLRVPGDFSSAAPFIVAATLLSGSELRLQGVGVNSTRTGLLAVLERMGARAALFNRRTEGGEPIADVDVAPADLTATTVEAAEVPLLVDELPLFALAAAMAHGDSVVRGAQELRVKESDRIEAVKNVLRPLGIRIQTTHDGFRVRGVPSRPKGGGVVDAAGDHRIAMLAAVAGLVSREGVRIQGAESVAVSFPDFFAMLDSIAVR